MQPTDIFLPDAEAAERLGRTLASLLERGDALCLSGPLGAGKSTLARGLIRALTTPDEEVPSPTFTLVQTYDGPAFPIAHFDLYRLEHAGEAEELGLDDALDEGAALIEWPERLEGRLPPDRLDIDIALEGEGRRARLTPHGAWKGRPLEL
ncbi:MAG TPA: tRNA (adenosine(37)-N6)-threonylcarbamoyltransferase complex ATPase subunit type 1 TsaE [Caulobacteraceae bacterium]|nr:tRNA (adenosine(37)-N6)-threonylcarbamoyltransferase complex ATPase subunit type 1 TsaE [Caulobacteraceae bacterium]